MPTCRPATAKDGVYRFVGTVLLVDIIACSMTKPGRFRKLARPRPASFRCPGYDALHPFALKCAARTQHGESCPAPESDHLVANDKQERLFTSRRARYARMSEFARIFAWHLDRLNCSKSAKFVADVIGRPRQREQKTVAFGPNIPVPLHSAPQHNFRRKVAFPFASIFGSAGPD